MNKYHNAIMNLQIPEEVEPAAKTDSGGTYRSYKIGHRDARHAAAEIALFADSQIEELVDTLQKAHEELQAWRQSFPNHADSEDVDNEIADLLNAHREVY